MKIVKKCLAHLVNESFGTGVFYFYFLLRGITAIFTKGELSDASCYRPLFMLLFLIKIFEQRMCDKKFQDKIFLYLF